MAGERNIPDEQAMYTVMVKRDEEINVENLAPKPGAMVVREMVERMLVGDKQEKENVLGELDDYVKPRIRDKMVDGKGCHSFAALSRLVESVDGGKYVVSGEDHDDYKDLWNLRADLVDGFTLAAILKPGWTGEFREAIESGDRARVEKFLGLDEDDVLCGIGQVIIDTTITDEKLLKCLGTLQIGVNSGRDLHVVYAGVVERVGSMIVDSEIDYGQGQMVLVYLNEMLAQQEVAGGAERVGGVGDGGEAGRYGGALHGFEGLIPVDDDPEEERNKQLSFVRPILERVEAVVGPVESNVALRQLLDRVEQSLDRFRPEVQSEIRARLSVHFCAQLMKQANGVLMSKEGGMTMGRAAFIAEYYGKEPTEEILQFLFGSDSNGLDVAGAWDMVQLASFGSAFVSLLGEMSNKENLALLKKRFGSNVTQGALFADLAMLPDNDPESNRPMSKKNYATDSGNRKKWCRYFLACKLARKNDYFDMSDQEEAVRFAQRTIRLAENAQLAYGEANMANARGQVGVDDLAELVNVHLFMEGKGVRTKAGPVYLKGLVKDIPNAISWLRTKVKPGFNKDQPLLIESLRKAQVWKKVAYGDYSFHNMVTLVKIRTFVMEFLLNVRIKPEDVTSVTLRDVADLEKRCGPHPDIVMATGSDGRSDYYSIVEAGGHRYAVVKGKRWLISEGKAHVVIDRGGQQRKYDVLAGGVVLIPDRRGERKAYLVCDDDDKGRYITYRFEGGDGDKKVVVKEEVRPHVAGHDNWYVVRGMNGKAWLRLRFLQGLVDSWLSDSDSEVIALDITKLEEEATRAVREDSPPFISPEVFRRYVLGDKNLHIAERLNGLESLRYRRSGEAAGSRRKY